MGFPQTRHLAATISNHRRSRWYEEGPLKGPLGYSKFNSPWSRSCWSFSWSRMYRRIWSSSRPTVLTQYPPCPETPAEQRPFRVQQLPVDPGRTLALQVADRHGDAALRGHAQQHVDVVRHCLTLHQLDILLPAQISQDLPDASPHPPVQHLATVLREDDDVILAVPLHVGLALPILHGGLPAPRGLPRRGPS